MRLSQLSYIFHLKHHTLGMYSCSFSLTDESGFMLWFLKTIWGIFLSVRSPIACPTFAGFSLVLLLKSFKLGWLFLHLLLFDQHSISAIVSVQCQQLKLMDGF